MKGANALVIFVLLASLAINIQSTYASDDEPEFFKKEYTKDSAKTSNAQESAGPLIFQEAVEVDGVSTDQLYSAALVWFAQTFGSGKEVIQVQDREAGTIIGKALFQYKSVVWGGGSGIDGDVSYLVKLQFKDGRYRYTIDRFRHEGNAMNRGGAFSFGLITNDEKCPYKVYGPSPGGREKTWTDLKNKSQEEAGKIIKALNAHMASAKKQDSDW